MKFRNEQEKKLWENAEKAFHGSMKSNDVADEIRDAISKVDDSLSYSDFATAIAKILKEDYGSHNFDPFMKVLHKELGM